MVNALFTLNGRALLPAVRKQFFGAMPPVMKQIFSAMVRYSMRKALCYQGMGRLKFMILDKSIYRPSRHGSGQIIMGGSAPIDAIAYAFFAKILVPPFDSPVTSRAIALDHLQVYCDCI